MLVEGLMLVAGAAGTIALGIPVAVSLARPHRWRSVQKADALSRRVLDIDAGFTPLDFGPDPMQWPSERPWPGTSRLTPLDWPSKHWDDDHFGAQWRDGRMVELEDLGFHAMAARDPRAGAREWLEEESGRQQKVRAEQARRQQLAAEEVRRKAARQLESRERLVSSDAPTPKRAPKRVQERRQQRRQRAEERPQQQQQSRPRAQLEGPSKAELEQLVAQVGLAGTVQEIMKRTGWDFRKAAHYLAKMRQ